MFKNALKAALSLMTFAVFSQNASAQQLGVSQTGHLVTLGSGGQQGKEVLRIIFTIPKNFSFKLGADNVKLNEHTLSAIIPISATQNRAVKVKACLGSLRGALRNKQGKTLNYKAKILNGDVKVTSIVCDKTDSPVKSNIANAFEVGPSKKETLLVIDIDPADLTQLPVGEYTDALTLTMSVDN